MHEINRTGRGRDVRRSFKQVVAILMNIEDRVLAVPVLDPLVVPEHRSDDVDTPVATSFEPAGPLRLGLKVEVAGTDLAWDGCGEQHRIRERAQRLDQLV